MDNVGHHRSLWAEALETENYRRNRMYSYACKFPSKTPWESLKGTVPNLSHIHELGCNEFVCITKPMRYANFDARDEVGRLMGYKSGAYRVLISESANLGSEKMRDL